ncbi:MAG: hypothetical protein N4A33_00895 [Bacteriovoracaceae bacterium]|jgi:hypothetical protein|nr:hypothetical protein [Bacteriovoracaceae bacterium]
MKILILSIFLAISCSSIKNSTQTNIEKIDEIYSNQYSRDKTKSMFDAKFEEGDDFIWVMFNPTYPDISLTYKNKSIIKAVYYIDKKSIGEARSFLDCELNIKKEYKTFDGQNYKLIESADCNNKEISYHYNIKRGMYELTWNRARVVK